MGTVLAKSRTPHKLAYRGSFPDPTNRILAVPTWPICPQYSVYSACASPAPLVNMLQAIGRRCDHAGLGLRLGYLGDSKCERCVNVQSMVALTYDALLLRWITPPLPPPCLFPPPCLPHVHTQCRTTML